MLDLPHSLAHVWSGGHTQHILISQHGQNMHILSDQISKSCNTFQARHVLGAQQPTHSL